MNDLTGEEKERSLPYEVDDTIFGEKFLEFFEAKIEKLMVELKQNNQGADSHVETTEEDPPPENLETLDALKEVDLAGVKELIKNSKKTCNLTDPYPIQDISQAKNFDKIVQIFCNIINCSFKCNKFPDSEKQAVIHPFYKGEGDKNSFKYCRPISNLSFLSKIIEKVALAQLQKLLTINKVIPENQSAYRANHSTESCMIAVTNDLLLNMDSGKNSLLFMLDLSAAFDTVEHSFLLDDLREIGRCSGAWARFSS